MADQDSIDLIFKIESSANTYVPGSSQTLLNYKESDMATGFKPGFMMELLSFSMSTSLDGSSSKDEETTAQADVIKTLQASYKAQFDEDKRRWKAGGKQGPEPVMGGKGLDGSGAREEFQEFKSNKAFSYQPELSPVEITRSMDKASPELLSHCINRTSLKGATLIKRKAAGGKLADGRDTSGEIYLRLDFDGVLITKVDWDEDDPVKEKITFISRAVTISYRPQLPDGSLGAVIPGFVKMAEDLRIFSLTGSGTSS